MISYWLVYSEAAFYNSNFVFKGFHIQFYGYEQPGLSLKENQVLMGGTKAESEYLTTMIVGKINSVFFSKCQRNV